MTELFDCDDDEPLPERVRPILVPLGTQLPPPPPGTRHVQLPRVGLLIADDDLRERVERWFYWPMILLALAVLPLFALEIYRKPVGVLALAVDIGFATIWAAFLVEFIAKITIAESRAEYVRRNWLDLVVILLPVLRIFRVTALARSARLFKLRGVAYKFMRTVITVFVSMEMADKALDRMGLSGAKPALPKPTVLTRNELIDEVLALRERINAWEDWYQAHRGFLEQRGVLTYELPDDDLIGPEPEAQSTADTTPSEPRDER